MVKNVNLMSYDVGNSLGIPPDSNCIEVAWNSLKLYTMIDSNIL